VSGALGGMVVGISISPLAQGGLDEAFGLAVSAGRVGASALVTKAMLLTEAAEDEGLIAGAIIGEHLADGDAEAAVIGQGGGEEGSGRGRLLIGQDLGEGDAGVIVDGDMDEVPAQAAGTAALVAMNAVADLGEAAEFLDIEMQQIAGGSMFVALRRGGGLQIAQAIEFEPSQQAADRGRAKPGMSGDAATRPALTAPLGNLLGYLWGGGLAQAMGTRAAVLEVGGIRLIATDPLAGGLVKPWRTALAKAPRL
jgi:hypothetical protein